MGKRRGPKVSLRGCRQHRGVRCRGRPPMPWTADDLRRAQEHIEQALQYIPAVRPDGRGANYSPALTGGAFSVGYESIGGAQTGTMMRAANRWDGFRKEGVCPLGRCGVQRGRDMRED